MSDPVIIEVTDEEVIIEISEITPMWGTITGDMSAQDDLTEALAGKADTDTVYTKTETDALLADKADADDVYTKTQTDTLLSAKADADDVYTKTETDALLSAKADASAVYTKSETDTLLSAKANTADLGTMAAVDDAPSDGKQYARKDGAWSEVEAPSGGGAWGEITGTLSDQTDLQTVLDSKADIIISSAEGNIVSIEDGAPHPVTALTVGIEPVQDLHGQSNPYPAGGGKNLYNPDNLSHDRYNSAGTLYQDTKCVSSDFIPVSPSTQYTLSVNAEMYALIITEFDENKTWIKNNSTTHKVSQAWTLGATTAYVRCLISVDNTNEVNLNTFVATYHPQLEQGSTATSYAPYSNICPISGQTEANVYLEDEYDAQADPKITETFGQTVFGGSVDVLNGTLTVTDENIPSYNGEVLPSTWISDRDVYAPDTSPTTGAQVVYKLAEPLTVQLDPETLSTLLGTNVLWSDTGDVAVTYRADTKSYIQKQIGAVLKMLTTVEKDYVATQNYTANKTLIVGDKHYKTTTTIASGASLVVGTNIQEITLAEWVLSLV